MGWYSENAFDFVPGKRYLLKLYNLGGRSYRMNAWVNGVAGEMTVAENIVFTRYEVVFFGSRTFQ